MRMERGSVTRSSVKLQANFGSSNYLYLARKAFGISPILKLNVASGHRPALRYEGVGEGGAFSARRGSSLI